MELAIIGAGHVGLVTGACFAEQGHRVTMVDNDAAKIRKLKRGVMPIYEPGLEPLVKRGISRRRLTFTTAMPSAVKTSQIIFICVTTPQKPSGEADLTVVENVCRQIAQAMTSYRLIVGKSTVPVQTGERLKETIQTYLRKGIPFDVASNPEFLREGSAVRDLMEPDRIVIGVETPRAKALLTELYESFDAPLVVTDIASAELIKHASNSFLATKISYINAMATICERSGADVMKVAEGMGLDPRIGPAFLQAGIGWGGSCFPKDVNAFIHIADKLGYDFQLLKAVRAINDAQRDAIVKKVEELLWIVKDKTIGVWGVAFKPDTDDIRNAPALEILQRLEQEGARLQLYDPHALARLNGQFRGMKRCRSAYEAARGADCLLLLTEWQEFKDLNFTRLKQLVKRPLLVDGRNFFRPEVVGRAGFRYVGVGRP